MSGILSIIMIILSSVLGVQAAPASAPAPAAPVTMPACVNEDGSGVGQAFPCAWDGGANGIGAHYVLTGPVNGV